MEKDSNTSLNSFEPEAVIKGKQIDQGGQSIVYEGTYYDINVVIKEYDKEFDYDKREIDVYSKLSHHIMVKFYGYYFDNQKRLNLVLDYAEGDTLDKLIVTNGLNFKQKLNLLSQLCDFLIYLKSNKTIHRDLKANNLKVKILNKDEVSLKIIDFGIAKINTQTQSRAFNDYSTISFAPPEIYDNDIDNMFRISYKYDVWSFGLIVSYLMTGIFPWCKTSKDSLKTHSLKVERNLVQKNNFLIPDYLKELNSDLYSIVSDCTKLESKDRADPTNIKEILLQIIKNDM